MTSLPQALAQIVEQAAPLVRSTTVGIGGPARFLARPTELTQLEWLLAWAADEGIDVVPLGLGSNILVADTGVDALVVRLQGDLARVDVRGATLAAGGGAANAVCLHRARAAGLGGLEFACAIPGTAGGGVRMNAGAFGSDWKAVMSRARVVGTDGAGWLGVDELELSYRHSALKPGQVVAAVEFALTPRPPAEIKRVVADLNARRKASQPTNRRTFGSVFKNPSHEHGAGKLLDACGLKGHAVGGARFSPRHANFIESVDGATAADAVALMAEGRRRVREEFGVLLEREVELLGDLVLPAVGDTLP